MEIIIIRRNEQCTPDEQIEAAKRLFPSGHFDSGDPKRSLILCNLVKMIIP